MRLRAVTADVVHHNYIDWGGNPRVLGIPLDTKLEPGNSASHDRARNPAMAKKFAYLLIQVIGSCRN